MPLPFLYLVTFYHLDKIVHCSPGVPINTKSRPAGPHCDRALSKQSALRDWARGHGSENLCHEHFPGWSLRLPTHLGHSSHSENLLTFQEQIPEAVRMYSLTKETSRDPEIPGHYVIHLILYPVCNHLTIFREYLPMPLHTLVHYHFNGHLIFYYLSVT